MEKRRCLDCGEPIRGRSDKKFCSDQCRNNYNNRLYRDELNFVRNVQNILRRNRRILSEMNPAGTAKVHRDELISRGFNFTFHTHTLTDQAGKSLHFCFEQGYSEMEDDYFTLLVRDDYNEMWDIPPDPSVELLDFDI